MIGQATPLPQTYNFRGLGSLPAGGRLTKEGVFFRSDALHLLSDEGRSLLRELKVATILDLRDDDEVLHAPSALTGLDVEVLRGNVLAGALGTSLQSLPTLPGLYRMILAQGGSVAVGLARSVTANASQGRSTLVHCTAGKDRTGVMVALLLDAVGVDREAIVADYAGTEANLAGEWLEGVKALLGKMGVPVSEQILAIAGGSPASAMLETLELLDADFGGGAGYLTHHGLTAAELEALRAALLTGSV
ncbi:protein-tyrosine phosphatase [Arthrobacter woluwensis]|uniref:tyrosine-protein phosphatase n=1 Tax=Arthrobacter woluwensis TaxID=156980 RepID=UPI002789EE52|nr:tyrosine-protein phosphatase [Arthrobacter woluwensis]MDQ0708523.1 protein-tyrosine phosphatase [Arthrobacter woluwensis]